MSTPPDQPLAAPPTSSELQQWSVEWVPRGRLHLNPANPRKNEDAVGPVAASLRRFGWQGPIVAKRDGEVVAGNTRLKAAAHLGMDLVPVLWFEGDDREALAFGIADNRTSEFAEWDEPALAEMLRRLRDEDALSGVGFDDDQVRKMLADCRTAAEPEPPLVEPPDTPVSATGDLWLLGSHTLLCGDATDAADVARVMGSDKAALCCTDPPYGVNFQDAEGKNIAADIGYSVIPAFFGIAVDVVAPGRALLLFGAENNVGLYTALAGRELKMRPRLLFWRKPAFVMRHHDYHSQFECIYYCWKQGGDAATRWRGGRDQSDVWDVGRDVAAADKVHPTQKPVELFVRAMLNHTDAGEIVFEPFSGSGSQLVAAEKVGRVCRALEIEPRFVDAAVERWQRATGKSATLDGSGQTFEQVRAARATPPAVTS